MGGEYAENVGEHFTREQKQADDVLRFLEPNPNLPPHLKSMAAEFARLARIVVDICPRCPQRTMALNSLLDAKDRAVRALL